MQNCPTYKLIQCIMYVLARWKHYCPFNLVTSCNGLWTSRAVVASSRFLPARRSDKRRLCYGNMAGWVAVCHSRYCISADTQFQGEPLQRGH